MAIAAEVMFLATTTVVVVPAAGSTVEVELSGVLSGAYSVFVDFTAPVAVSVTVVTFKECPETV